MKISNSKEKETEVDQEIIFDLWTIDKSMGESRFAQILGGLVIVGLVIFAYLFKYGYFKGLF